MKGVSRKAFQNQFSETMDSIYGDVIRNLCRLKLLEDDGETVKLTGHGIEISNPVLSEFLLD